ncbi:hypothetical protein SKAU_G00049340 [Synaphobranchus kaupii]|uniref:Cystatin domain-containing protein n=1 Tax=Synaphobranchus kaupii TaxID=118154 RepID=A0A9Q1J7F4_SYNKA|nr:hypothetical protein SKAU_G00049340 [Synaphobranchus kaupii]
MIDQDDKSVLKTVEMSLEKYNRESRNANYFGLLNVTRASPQGGIADFTFAEFTIQETVCSNSTDVAEAAKCALMDCEFADKESVFFQWATWSANEISVKNCFETLLYIFFYSIKVTARPHIFIPRKEKSLSK